MGSVRYLLDTHTLLWAVREESRLNVTTCEIIRNVNTQLFVSAVSAYEIMNKHRIGKMQGYEYVADNYFDILQRFSINELPISARHAHYAENFEWEHRDPFDRLLAAQAFTENMTLITNDSVFQALPWVAILW